MHLSPRADANSAGEAVFTAMPAWAIALIALILVVAILACLVFVANYFGHLRSSTRRQRGSRSSRRSQPQSQSILPLSYPIRRHKTASLSWSHPLPVSQIHDSHETLVQIPPPAYVHPPKYPEFVEKEVGYGYGVARTVKNV